MWSVPLKTVRFEGMVHGQVELPEGLLKKPGKSSVVEPVKEFSEPTGVQQPVAEESQQKATRRRKRKVKATGPVKAEPQDDLAERRGLPAAAPDRDAQPAAGLNAALGEAFTYRGHVIDGISTLPSDAARRAGGQIEEAQKPKRGLRSLENLSKLTADFSWSRRAIARSC